MCSSWKGVPISYIVGSQSPWGAPEFPLVQPSYNHTVLYHIPDDAQLDRPPKPQIGHEKWDQEHVRLPFSTQSLYPVENSAGETKLKNRWDMVQNALNRPIRNSKELAKAILSYNTQFKNRWKFTALHYLFEEYLEEEESQYFFDVTLQEIAKLALSITKLIQAPIPLLKQNKNRSISLSQQQISCLLANAFFCTFPRRNTTKKNSEYASYPYINFNVLYECEPSNHVVEKLKCICHYFRRVCTKVPVGVVTVSRRSVPVKELPDWKSSERIISELPVHCDSENTIEEAHGLIQVDFANKYLGGGVLSYGSVQEEIRFMICPELMISMLFTEELKPNEALMVIGCEQYSTYSGYGHSFSWGSNYNDITPRDSSGRKRTAVLAIDALPVRSRLHEMNANTVTRDINKTMALTEAGRPLAYYTFDDKELRDDIIGCYELLVRHQVTVGQLYNIIMNYCDSNQHSGGIYTYLEHALDNRKPVNNKNDTGKNLKSDTNDSGNVCDDLILARALDFSPDIFLQDEDMSEYSMDLKVNTEDTAVIDLDTSTSDGNKCVDSRVTAEEQEVQENTKTNQTSRLFDEMEKLDQDSGKLNLKSQQKTFFGQKNNDLSMDAGEKLHTDISPDVKKKLTKKITDYFSKRPI
ncbi:poly [Danaus plexippus plexippus]|uniref:poly(ADP-ribose) glycohydrolase n=1 Tax=Danaus plexippus plexippus TaxID=278856 RepID=A0A212ER22_DANPL|nr:poly(ADP-ribose) glycohydrolase-like [Danaus plexippus plexippus]OWR43927.1 poly [Danaus plexippus plexippus]